MAWRRRRQLSLPDNSNRHVPNNMDHLAFKYMEMCKVDTDSDSDSEISPRWSDTSSMGCASRVPQRTLRRTLPLKPAARHGCSSFLDPYDGSSEDSDEPGVEAGVSRQPKQQGRGAGGAGGWSSGRGRRSVLPHPASIAVRQVMKTAKRDPAAEHHHLLDVPMNCGSDSEVWVCELQSLPTHNDKDGGRETVAAKDSTMQTQTMDIEFQLDSGLQATISATPHTFGAFTAAGGNLSQMQDSSSERSLSPCNFTSIYKRKLCLPGADVVELGRRKRQCVNVEDEHIAMDSTSEPC